MAPQSCAITLAYGMIPGSRVDNLGHLGGLLGGAAASFAAGPRLVTLDGRGGHDALGRYFRSGGAVIADRPLLRLAGITGAGSADNQY